MTDTFDILTVACFLLVVIAFFVWTDRDTRTLLHLSICVVAFAVANELGRIGSSTLASILIAVGLAYALLVLVKTKRAGDGTG